MRPLKLTVQGFTCFRDKTEIDFAGMDVFAITGRTGSGKTTIMDAICYALYGRVPRGSDVGELITRGAPTMSVQFDFASGQKRYRAGRRSDVNRKTDKLGQTKVQLERHIADDEWEPLDDRVREMNAEIERIIGLDFDGFQRCVLLPQGRFHEMLTGDKPKRRKVLEELLDAQIYERIMQSANARAKLDQQLAKTKQDLLDTTFKDATEEALEAANLVLEDQRPRLAAAQATLAGAQQASKLAQTVREARANEKQKREQLAELAAAIKKAETINATGEKKLATLAAAIAAAQAELAGVAYDPALHQKLGAAEVLARQVESLARKASDARERASDTSTTEQCKRDQTKAAAAHADAEAAVKEAERIFEEARVAHSAAFVQRGLKAGDPCPVCGGTVAKLPRLKASEVERAESAVDKAKANEKKAATAAATASKQAALAAQALASALAEAKVAEEELNASQRDLAAQLPKGIEATVTAITARKKELDEAARKRTSIEQRIEQTKAELEQADAALASAKAEITSLKGQAKALEQQADADHASGDAALTELRAIVDRLHWTEIAARIDEKKDPGALIDSLNSSTQQECDSLVRGIAQLEERAQTIAERIHEAKQHRAEMEAAAASAALHDQLAKLLQAGQFRDWYIGEAMTLLAQAASRRLETLDSERRYGLTVQNTEFRVVDRWEGEAVRGADTLSGGETFVVSLALALALAEQLPQIQSGAGAALESLFLDEGFGTLDADTLEPVINALGALRAEGRTVGIITHVSELAQRIDHRIEVHKKQGGSTVTVV